MGIRHLPTHLQGDQILGVNFLTALKVQDF
jgi:hypothetical protein